MSPRYFALCTPYDRASRNLSKYSTGRHAGAESALIEARARYGAIVQSVRIETGLEAKLFAARCVIVRAVRLLAAVIVGFIGYALLSASPINITDVPLGELTLSAIGTALLKGGLWVALVGVCGALAFGDGHPDSPFPAW